MFTENTVLACSFFFSMTVMEHMEFYAGVKSHQSAAETREEIWK